MSARSFRGKNFKAVAPTSSLKTSPVVEIASESSSFMNLKQTPTPHPCPGLPNDPTCGFDPASNYPNARVRQYTFFGTAADLARIFRALATSCPGGTNPNPNRVNILA